MYGGEEMTKKEELLRYITHLTDAQIEDAVIYLQKELGALREPERNHPQIETQHNE